MQVKDFLAGVGVAVYHGAVAAVGDTQLPGQPGHHRQQVAGQGGIVEVVHGGQVAAGNEQQVLGRSRVNVAKGQADVVLVDDVGGDFTGGDLAKETIGHGNLPSHHCLAQAGRRVQTLLLAVLALLSACAAVGTRPGSDLPSILNSFHHDLRWQYFRKAAARVDPARAREFLDQLEDEEADLHITDWEIREVKPQPDGKRALVRVRLKYYRMPSTVVHDETVLQTWRRTDGGWILVEQQGGPFSFPPPATAPRPAESDAGQPAP